MSSRHEIPSKQDGHVVTVGWDNPLQTFFAQVENQRAPEPESLVLWLGGQPREHTAPETMVAALRPYADLGADMLKTLTADRTVDINRAPTPMQQAWLDMLDKQEPDHRPTPATPPVDPGARAAVPEAGSDGVRSSQTGTAAGTAQPSPAEDPIKKLVGEMQEAAGRLGPGEQRLQQTVATIADQAQEPTRVQDPGFRTAVAYALQDFQRFTTETFQLDPVLAREMAERAVASPGLTNPRLQTLMEQTATLTDRGLINEIRTLARDTVTRGQRQDGAGLNADIEPLENRARILRPPRVEGAPPPGAIDPQASAQTTSQGRGNSAPQATAQASAQQVRQPSGKFIQVPDRARRNDVVFDLVRKMRAPIPSRVETQQPAPAYSVDERVSLFEKRMAEAKTNGLIDNAERSGMAAIEAAERFVTGPGRGILGKMQAAASTEPGGMETVMKEMQPGGRYANLRAEFDNAYQQDKIFAGVYDKLVESATQFGKDRLSVESNFATRGLDPNQLDGRFQKAEEAISEATATVPGKTPGKSMLEEMTEKIAEIFKRAYAGVKGMFGQETTAEAAPKQGPSPGMSP